MPPDPVKPYSLMAKPTGAQCNLNCAYCWYLERHAMLYPDRKWPRMSDEVLQRYTLENIRCGGPVVRFLWQGGEPTLMGVDFFERAAELQRKHLGPGQRVECSLQTNATLIDDRWAEFLRREGFLVGVSVDGPDYLHDCYRRAKGGQPTHARVLRGLRRLRDHGVEVNALVVVNDRNAEHPEEVLRFLVGAGLQHIQFIPAVEVDPATGRPFDFVPSPEAFGRFLCRTFDLWRRKHVGHVWLQHIEQFFAALLQGQTSLCVSSIDSCGRNIIIEHDGTLYACDHFVWPEWRLGNVMDEPLDVLLDTANTTRLNALKRALSPRCEACEYKFACWGGCPKHRFDTSPERPTDNYLCEGYLAFFRHAEAFLREMADDYRRAQAAASIPQLRRPTPPAPSGPVGRNDPCPCGSGLKYKRCCGRAV